MKHIILSLLFISALAFSATSQTKKIILEFESDEELVAQDYDVQIRDINEVDISLESKGYPLLCDKSVLKWQLLSDTPVVILSRSKIPFLRINCPLEPGDSIRAKKQNGQLFFTGKGAEKFELKHKINNAIDKNLLSSLLRTQFKMSSLSDFFNQVNSMGGIWDQELSLINEYQQRMSRLSFFYFKASYLNIIQDYVGTKFSVLTRNRDSLGLHVNDLKNIYDSTLLKYELTGEGRSDSANLAIVTYGLLKLAEVKSNLKVLEAETLPDDLDRRVARYYYAKEMYSGLAQRKVLSYLVTYILRKHLEPKAIAVANDFLSLYGYSRYREYVQKYLTRQLGFEKGKSAPAFNLYATNDKVVSLEKLKGKIVFMDFWFTGCKGCVQLAESLKPVEKYFKDNPNVEFLSVSTDASKPQWLSSIAKGKYTTGTATNVYTGGKGREHSMIAAYNVTAYPTVFLVDSDGKFVRPVPDPRRDNGKALIALINKLQPYSLVDGPYVLYKNEKTVVKSVDVNENGVAVVKETKVNKLAASPLLVPADIAGKTFEVKIKDSLVQEPSVFEQPAKALVISDIEGEFTALRDLLQANRVIDTNFNWTFGNGHLICVGDFFDRGRQVTEVLWLIYSLEEKAKAKGGYVHFILGNHEIMNLAGDIRYLHKKYISNAKLLNEDYVSGLFGEHSELGRWLRTKNIIEKIGNALYVHGGISSEFNNLHLSLVEINNLARTQYAKKIISTEDKVTQTIMDNQVGPFWYRGYYKSKNINGGLIDSTLAKFNVNKIVTGHTMIDRGEQVTTHFDGKLINTDTHHKEGHSEALLIEGRAYYRVNGMGNKTLLFNSDQDFMTSFR